MRRGLARAAVRDLRESRAPATEDEIADFETDVPSGFLLARAPAGLVDATIRIDVNHLELIRDWLGRRCGRCSLVTPIPISARCCAMPARRRAQAVGLDPAWWTRGQAACAV